MHTSPLSVIVRQFIPFDTCLAVTPVGAGNINDTYRVDIQIHGKKQSWLLQRLNHKVFTDPDAVMRNIRAVAAHLEQLYDFPLRVPAPVATSAGKWLHRDDAGNYWRVFPFYDNTYAPEHLPEPAVAFEAAQAYGAFLYALRDFSADELAETIPGFHDTERRWAVFEDILKKNPANRQNPAQAEIDALFEARTVFTRVHRLKQSGELPRRVTHNDTKAGNVLLDTQTGRAVAVIDWDTIMPGTVLSDFGDMVRTFAPDCPEDGSGSVNLRLDTLEALCRGFLGQTAGFLTALERQNLPLGALWIIGEQALRFLTDYLAGDTYYKIRYAEHNLVRARNQLALFREVERHKALLQEMCSGAGGR